MIFSYQNTAGSLSTFSKEPARIGTSRAGRRKSFSRYTSNYAQKTARMPGLTAFPPYQARSPSQLNRPLNRPPDHARSPDQRRSPCRPFRARSPCRNHSPPEPAHQKRPYNIIGRSHYFTFSRFLAPEIPSKNTTEKSHKKYPEKMPVKYPRFLPHT